MNWDQLSDGVMYQGTDFTVIRLSELGEDRAVYSAVENGPRGFIIDDVNDHDRADTYRRLDVLS